MSEHSGKPVIAPESLESPDGRVEGARPSSGPLAGDCSSDAMKIIELPIERLRRHRLFAELGLEVPASVLTSQVQRGDLAFRDLINIAADDTVLDGYPLWKLAQLQKHSTVLCRRHNLSECEQLLWIVQKLQSPSWTNDYIHALAALMLKPGLRARALANQQLGGKLKGSANLQEADRVDVLEEISRETGISARTLRKAERLEEYPAPEVKVALRAGEIRIDRAWGWLESTHGMQLEKLKKFREQKGAKKVVREMLSKHLPTKRPILIDVKQVLNDLLSLLRAAPASIQLQVVKVEGKFVFLTDELFQLLCARKSNVKEKL
jgi:hypothetical protein